MTNDRPNESKPLPHPPSYSAQAQDIAADYHLDPRLVQQLIDEGKVRR